MAAALFGTTMNQWGLDAETGILCQSFDRKLRRAEKVIKNHEGEDVAMSKYNPIAEYDVQGYITGASASGVAAEEAGSAVTLANTTSGNGVTAGLVISNDVDIKQANEDFAMVSLTATQRPLITT